MSEKTKKPINLVVGHLERVSQQALEKRRYMKALSEVAGEKPGIYALFKGERLVYVGLSVDILRRLKEHRSDHLAKKWNRFSFYITDNADSIREIEAIIQSISNPEGNKQKGKIGVSEDAFKKVKKIVRELEVDAFKRTFEQKKKRNGETEIKGEATIGKGPVALAGLVSQRRTIRMEYKGCRYDATLRADGRIGHEGAIYNHPTAAAKKISGRTSGNGWAVWKYKNKNGDWVPLSNLRDGIAGAASAIEAVDTDRPGAAKAPTPIEKPAKKPVIDTVVCPAREDGFQEFFLGSNFWGAAGISPQRMHSLKYIAIYRPDPVSAVTHFAEIESIERLEEDPDYVVIYCKGKPQEIGPIPKGGVGIQRLTYTDFEKLKTAKTVDDLRLDN